MEAIVELLKGVRAEGAFLLRTVMDPPWSMRIADQAPLTVVAAVRAGCWIVPDGGPATRLQPADAALIRGPDPYVVADQPDTPPSVLIGPGQRCTTIDGADLSMTMHLGVRTWGNTPDGEHVLLTGTYEGRSETGRLLLDALPPVVTMTPDDTARPLLTSLSHEMLRSDPGQEVVLDRLLDLLLVTVVRSWCASQHPNTPSWWRADRDPLVRQAIQLLTDDPAQPWTVTRLAATIGISRAGLARRFTEVVGEPPITFLTRWRLAVAADRLRTTDDTLTAIAGQVGYANPFALSSAFKRAYRRTPTEHRRQGAWSGRPSRSG